MTDSLLIKSINLSIKEINYCLTVENLIEILIREYTNLNLSLKITKKFIEFLNLIVKVQNFGTIKHETNVENLNEIYTNLLNLLIIHNILFDFNKIYIENRLILIQNKNKMISEHLKNSCEYMENLILTHIKKRNFSQNCTIGEMIVFFNK